MFDRDYDREHLEKFHEENPDHRQTTVDLNELIITLIKVRDVMIDYPHQVAEAEYWKKEAQDATRQMLDHGNQMTGQIIGALLGAAGHSEEALMAAAKGAAGVEDKNG